MCIKGDTTYTTHYMCKGIHEKFLGARQTCKSARRTAEQTAKLCTHTSARGTAMQKKGERKASRSQDAISQKIPSPLRPRQTQICPGNLVQTVMTVPQNRHDHDFDTSVRFATPFCFFQGSNSVSLYRLLTSSTLARGMRVVAPSVQWCCKRLWRCRGDRAPGHIL